MPAEPREPRAGELWTPTSQVKIAGRPLDPGDPILVLDSSKVAGSHTVSVLKVLVEGQMHEIYVTIDILRRML